LRLSSHPVSFNLTFKGKYSQFLKSPTIQFTLSPGEVRSVLIEVKDKEYFLRNSEKLILSVQSNLDLEVTAFQPGLDTNGGGVIKKSALILVKENFKPKWNNGELVIQVAKDRFTFDPGMIVNY